MVKSKPKFNSSKKQNDPLITAIQRGNLELVQNIVNKAGLDFSQTWLEGYTLLCTAIKYHRSQMALWFLSKDCRINRADAEDISDTPIHLAIYNNENAVAKALIEKGACLNVKNYKGETPLHISCQRKNIDIIELLLKDDSIADIPDSKLTTPLHIAVEIECLEIIEILLKHKVNINAYTVKNDFKGFTPLHIAICKRNEKIIKMLLDNGADLQAPVKISNLNGFQDENFIDLINYQDFLPLHLATKVDDGNIMELLINYNADVDAAIEHSGMTALHIAVENKNKQNVILLSEYNANFRAETKEGKNILHLAVENDWPELIEVLLLKGADINVQTADGETPLHIAVEMGDENIVELLLIYQANVNLTNFMHKSPLHIAAEYSVDVVRLLLEKGANVDEVDNNNETPLGIAVKHKDIEIINEILQYKPLIQNSSNQDAFMFAITNPDYFYVKIVDLLLEYGFTITEKVDNINLFCNAIVEGHIRIIHYLLEHGMNVSKNQDNNCLHYAVKCQNYNIIKLLINYKCSINAIDQHGQTPIGYAIECNNLKIVDLLLSNGANILNITSPLLNAAKESNIFLVQILLDYGADINACDKFGTTVLHFAVWNKYHEFIQLLLNRSANVNTTDINLDKISATDDHDEENDDSYTKNFKKLVFTSPLHIAVSKKDKDICSTLLEHHTNVNSRDGYGRTALHLAAAIKSTEQKNLIRLLISYGADINTLDDFKRLPIYYIYNQSCVCSIAFQNQYEVYSECECALYEDYDINDVIEVFIKHIALLASMNKFVHIDNLKIISIQSDFSEKLQISCLHEIEKMKEEKIGDLLSFYDVLIKKSNSLAACACNEDIIQAFESTNYKSKFPLYYDVLKEKFQIALDRAYWLQTAALALNSLLKFKLPEIIVDNVFEPLHLSDLKNLSTASINSISDDNNPRKKFKVY